MVPLAALLLLMNGVGLRHTLGEGLDGLTAVATVAGSLLTLSFYAVVIAVYLRRSTAKATAPSRPVRVAAVVASWLPFTLPLLAGDPAGGVALLAADLLILAGLSWSVVSLRTLDRSFSIVPQARALVDHGPYRYIRHPLYTGELVAALGIVLTRPSAAAFLAWLLLACLLAYRVVHEEAVLERALPEYADYRRRTARLVPGLY